MKQADKLSQTIKGFTLIELLVALAIGAVLITSVFMVMGNSSRAARSSEAEAAMTEDAMLLLNMLQQQIRMVGYSNEANDGGVLKKKFDGLAILGCDHGFANAKVAFESLSCGSDERLSSVIAIRYEADNLNTFPTSSDTPSDCIGNGLKKETKFLEDYYLSDARYYLNGLGSNSLYCQPYPGLGATPTPHQPLFENVESVRFTYGVASDTPEGSTQIATYLDAAGINALAGSQKEKWGRVLSVRICVQVRSADPVTDGSPSSSKYFDCSGNTVSASDKYLHRTFVTTAQLRNRFSVPSERLK